MNYISGFDRKQAVLIPETIDQLIAPDNPVRFIDAFVDALNINEFGFKNTINKNGGRPAFNPKDLLKLYIYVLILLYSDVYVVKCNKLICN